MISKNKLRELAAYKQQKCCDAEGVFVVEGEKMCAEIVAANIPVRVVCATKSWLERHADLHMCMQVFEVDDVSLERISGLRTPNEVWMLLERHLDWSYGSRGSRLELVLDHIQDPGNLGTIIRTADWFGVRRIVCSEGTVSCFNPKVVQATMGGLLRTEIVYADLPDYLAHCGRPVYGAMLDGESIWSPAQRLQVPDGGAVLVVGNESRGISPEVCRQITRRIAIPNLGGTAESLNAAVACAVLLAELMRPSAR